MARDKTIKFLRTTRANLDTQKNASNLIIGEPYLITDESRLAIGIATNNYIDFAKNSEATGGLKSYKKLSSNFSTTSTSYVDITGLSESLAASKNYFFQAWLAGQSTDPSNQVSAMIPRVGGNATITPARFLVYPGFNFSTVLDDNNSLYVALQIPANGTGRSYISGIISTVSAGTFKIQTNAPDGYTTTIFAGSGFFIMEI